MVKFVYKYHKSVNSGYTNKQMSRATQKGPLV